MKVKQIESKSCGLGSLEEGDVFIYRSLIYIKTQARSGTTDACDVNSGRILGFAPSAKVVPVDGAFVEYGAKVKVDKKGRFVGPL